MTRTLAALALLIPLLAACGTSDVTLQQAGRSDAYIIGFHDGRHSGMREAGNNYEHYIQDAERFEADAEYKSGWLAGEAEGKKLQQQAVSVGNAAAGAYSGYQIGKEVEKSTDAERAAKDAVKDIDTSDLKVLEQQ